jgi:hypothetical protein
MHYYINKLSLYLNEQCTNNKSNKYKKQLNKLKDEVGMAGPKSTQTRLWG